jgi:hypothetical protein
LASYERRGIEITDAADVRIERQIAAEAQHRRNLELDDLLPVPAGHQVEAAERGEEVAFRPDRDIDVGKARQAGPQQVGVTARRHDQQFEGHGVAPMLGQRLDQETRALQIAPALDFAQSQGEKSVANLGKHRFGCSENTCGVWHLPHQSLEDAYR